MTVVSEERNHWKTNALNQKQHRFSFTKVQTPKACTRVKGRIKLISTMEHYVLELPGKLPHMGN